MRNTSMIILLILCILVSISVTQDAENVELVGRI